MRFQLNEKNDKFVSKVPQMYGSTVSFAYSEVFFLKIPTVKKFSPGGLLPPTGEYCPHAYKNYI